MVVQKSSAAALPEALIAQILQHVPQEQRLQQCALTCKAWAAAAALATVHVQRKLKAEGQAISALQSWVQKYAGQLESLQLSHSAWNKQPELQLPLGELAKLQRLQLQGFKLLLPGEGESSCSDGEGTPAAPPPLLLPSLQHLELARVQLSSVSSLLFAAGASGLTTLKTGEISFVQQEFCSTVSYGNAKAAVQQLAAAIPGLLQQLPRLAVLELPGMPISDAAAQQMGSMQGLQEVSLAQAEHMPTANLQPLPSTVTRLRFTGNRCGIGVPPNTPSLSPQLLQLAGLLQLELGSCDVPPTLLGAFTRLKQLKLRYCSLLPADPNSDYNTEGTAALFDALAKMTCLHDLRLSLPELDTVITAPQRFAALTASAHLTQLVLDPGENTPLAKGAVQYMFPAGRQLPLLRHITISPLVNYPHDLDADFWCIDGADIGFIAKCCTGLQWLDIGLSVRPGADLSGLLELPRSCTDVLVGGAAFGDSAASVLVQLTHLDYLCVHGSAKFTDAGLERLTALNLARLYVYNCALSDAVSNEGTLELLSDPQEGSVRQ